MAEFIEVLNGRNSVRSYKAEALTEEQIAELIRTGLQAPTARNAQEVRITAVSTAEPVIGAIQKVLNPDAEKNFYYDAPVLFVLSGRDDFKWSMLDAGIAVENMHLAAKAMGLGSVIIGCIDRAVLDDKTGTFNAALGIPEGYSFKIALAAGVPAAEKVPHTIDTEKNSGVIGL